jgi:hypothetical protein
MLRDVGERENSRVRDLIDLMLFLEHELLDRAVLARTVAEVWNERDGTAPPRPFPALPEGWPTRYERLAGEHDVDPPSFSKAFARAAALWDEMFPTEET